MLEDRNCLLWVHLDQLSEFFTGHVPFGHFREFFREGRIFGNEDCLCLLWTELSDVASGAVVHDLRRAVFVYNLAVTEPVFEFLRASLAQGVTAITDLYGFLDRLLGDLLASATIVHRHIVVEDDHHAHLRHGIAIIACVNYASFKLIRIEVCFFVDPAHFWTRTKDVVETLNVDVRSGGGDHTFFLHGPVILRNVEVDAVLDAIIIRVLNATRLSASSTSPVLGCV